MKVKAVIHNAEEGGYWAEVPGISGCATQGDTFEELLTNLYEAVEGSVSVEVDWAATQETLLLLSAPGMRESIRTGLETPIEECSTEPGW
jgi:predicted RNase H-like HicB family nuclease